MLARCSWSMAALFLMAAAALGNTEIDGQLSSTDTIPSEAKHSRSNRAVYSVIITDSHDEQRLQFFIPRGETVIDAIAKIPDLPTIANKNRVWLTRPISDKAGCYHILSVDWKNLVQHGDYKTNYALRPGDEIHIAPGHPERYANPIRVHGMTILQSGAVSPSALPQ